MTDLKPCPFCGGKVEIDMLDSENSRNVKIYSAVHCPECHEWFFKGLSRGKIIERWNRRAQQERENPQPLTLEELRRMDGEVVYIPESEEYFGGMGIVSVSQERVVDVGVPKFGYWLFREYGEGWRAYRSQRNLLIPTMERRKESDRE